MNESHIQAHILDVPIRFVINGAVLIILLGLIIFLYFYGVCKRNF
jgi:hypothetical protein